MTTLGNYCSGLLILVTSVTLFAGATPSADVLFDWKMADGRRAVLLRNSLVEEYPVEVEHVGEHFVSTRGGEIQIDVAVILVLGDDTYEPPTVAWTRAHPSSLHFRDNDILQQDIQLRQLHVYGAEMHENLLYIVYSENARIVIDAVQQADERRWEVVNTIELFVQEPMSGWSPTRRVKTACFVPHDDQLCLRFEFVGEAEAEVWAISSDGTVAVISSDVATSADE
jgi:hypothetical protein